MKCRLPHDLLLTVLAFRLIVPTVLGANWPHWRGPNFDGSSPEQGLPAQWTKSDGLAWKTPLPGPSGATPIIWNDTVFVTSPDPQKNLILLALDRRTGNIRWQETVATGDRTQGRNNMASPSPVTDGHVVVALFGTSDLAAFDFSGAKLWSRNLGRDFGKFSILWLYGSSPLFFEGKLYIQVLERDPPTYSNSLDSRSHRQSYLLCLDPKTGKDLWRHLRNTDALGESMEAYSSPIPYRGKESAQILIVGGDYLTSHDAESGAELWRCGGFNPTKRDDFRIVPSPVAASDIIVGCAPKGSPVFGIRAGGSGVVTETRVAWTLRESTSDWSTPLYYQNKLFILDGGRRMLTCLEPKTGKKIWQGNLGVSETIWSSPTGADGKIYCLGERGTVIVLSAGDEFKILSTIHLEEDPCRSSIAVADHHLFVRTAGNLYDIGAKD